MIVDVLRTWLLGLIAVALCLAVLEALVPKGVLRSIARVSGGLVLLVVLLRPWINMEIKELEGSYDTYRQRMDAQIESYQEAQTEEMKSVIEENTAAYICEKAASMGVVCGVSVSVTEMNGVLLPESVTLTAPYHRELSGWLSAEMGISAEAQYWG